MYTLCAFAALAVLGPSTAIAQQPRETRPSLWGQPRWGVGPYLGTSPLPTGYPIALPSRLANGNVTSDTITSDNTAGGVDVEGLPGGTTVERTHGRMSLGGTGWMWSRHATFRAGLTANVDLGRRFLGYDVLALLERTYLFDRGHVSINVGGGLGLGSMRWRGEDPDERLVVPNYPVRGQVAMLVPTGRTFAIESTLFAQLPLPMRHHYTDFAGIEHELHGVPFSYFELGLTIGGLYGRYW
jgi:hypothetical protein